MKVAAVIAEYNPFHTGHQYHLSKTRELTGADYILVLMSGDFVQRGFGTGSKTRQHFIRTNILYL